MPAFVDISGQRFGRWAVLKHVGFNKHNAALWLCRCDCGNEKAVTSNRLRMGRSTSCGCYKREQKHGRNKSKVHNAWVGMLSRCRNPKSSSYHKYGAKGIRVCERWHKFANFLADMGEPPTPQHTLDRFPNQKGDYEPGNVRWATMKQQQNNRTNNHRISAFGKTQTLQQWSNETDLGQATILVRLRLGWQIERALTERPHRP